MEKVTRCFVKKVSLITCSMIASALITGPAFARTPKTDEWGFANCEEGTYVNVRMLPSTESPVVGIMERAAQADVVGEVDDWLEIVSGDVKGYVADYLLETGDEAASLEEESSYRTASANKDAKVYPDPNPESSEAFTLKSGESCVLIETMEGWALVSTDDNEGFVKLEDLDFSTAYKKAEAIEFVEQINEETGGEEVYTENAVVEMQPVYSAYHPTAEYSAEPVKQQEQSYVAQTEPVTEKQEPVTEQETQTETEPVKESEETPSEEIDGNSGETEIDAPDDEIIYDADEDVSQAVEDGVEDAGFEGIEDVDAVITDDDVTVVDLDAEISSEE